LGISFNLSESDKLTLSPAHSENALNIDNDWSSGFGYII
jgi:hypothetical protein